MFSSLLKDCVTRDAEWKEGGARKGISLYYEKLVGARSRLYRSRFLQVDNHFAEIFNMIYKIVILFTAPNSILQMFATLQVFNVISGLNDFVKLIC